MIQPCDQSPDVTQVELLALLHTVTLAPRLTASLRAIEREADKTLAALATLLRAIADWKDGTAIDNKTPRMATVINSSIRVKPR